VTDQPALCWSSCNCENSLSKLFLFELLHFILSSSKFSEVTSLPTLCQLACSLGLAKGVFGKVGVCWLPVPLVCRLPSMSMSMSSSPPVLTSPRPTYRPTSTPNTSVSIPATNLKALT